MLMVAHEVRDSRPDDREAFVPLWETCLRTHDVVPDAVSAERIWKLTSSPESNFGMRVAATAEGLGGFAVHSYQINSWTGSMEGCLDTLFVAPAVRGGGLGRALIDDLLSLGRLRGWQSVFWHVRADNDVARALYDQYAVEDGYRRYRVSLAV